MRKCLSISEEVRDVARDYPARVPATCRRGVSRMGHFAVAFVVGVSGCGLVDVVEAGGRYLVFSSVNSWQVFGICIFNSAVL